MNATHTLLGLHPLDRGRYRWKATCSCGWQSDECPTSGRATSAIWAHIHEEARKSTATDRSA